MKVILYSLLLVGAVSAFSVKKVYPGQVKVKEGRPFKVICTTSGWYEVSLTLTSNYVMIVSGYHHHLKASVADSQHRSSRPWQDPTHMPIHR